MLPASPPLTTAVGTRWAGARPPAWVPRIALPSVWFVAVLVAFASDTGRCSAADPSVCGPDQGFAFWVTVCLATPVLLGARRTVAGCLAGVAFAIADLVFDPLPAVNVAFGLVGLLCAGTLVRSYRSRRAQRAIMREATGGFTVPTPGRFVSPRPDGPAVVGIALLVLVAAGCFGVYSHVAGSEQVHVDRAVRTDLSVTAVDDDDVSITVVDPSGRTHRIGVLTPGSYRQGAVVPVLLDPDDAGWARLVAEPSDSTGWQTGGYGALLLALLRAGEVVTRRRAGRALRSGAHPAVGVRVVPAGDAVLILPADATDPTGPQIASLDVDPSDLSGSLGPQPAVLLGALHDRGWATVLLDDGLLAPGSPLRSGTSTTLRADGPRGRPVTSGPARPDEAVLPVSVSAPVGQRVFGGLMALFGLAVPGWLLVDHDNWLSAALVALGGVAMCATGAGLVLGGLRIGPSGLRVISAFTVDEVPWAALHDVRHEKRQLFLAWAPDVEREAGPFAVPADELGALVLRLRDRMPPGGSRDRSGRVRTRPGPGWWAVAAYVVAALAALAGLHV